jgi:hypothetical protein
MTSAASTAHNCRVNQSPTSFVNNNRRRLIADAVDDAMLKSQRGVGGFTLDRLIWSAANTACGEVRL